MGDVVVVQRSDYPQTSSNRTRATASFELTQYVGGGDRPEALVRAGLAWDAAVREFNTVAWRFNRTETDITLVDGSASEAAKLYTLPVGFRSPQRCVLVDGSGTMRWDLDWLPYEVWRRDFALVSSTSALPMWYTAINVHGTGQIRFEPSIVGTPTYPTARLTYHSRISIAAGTNATLNVPMEVDQAIFARAAAILSMRSRGAQGGDSQLLTQEAALLRAFVEREHRDFGTLTGWGANG